MAQIEGVTRQIYADIPQVNKDVKDVNGVRVMIVNFANNEVAVALYSFEWCPGIFGLELPDVTGQILEIVTAMGVTVDYKKV